MRSRFLAAVLAAAAMCQSAPADPVSTPWPVPVSGGGAATYAAASAGLGGLWAASDGRTVEVRDVRQTLRLSRTLSDFVPLFPGLDAATARIGRVCFSESGRLLFVLIQRPLSGIPSVSRYEYVARIDTDTGTMTAFDTFINPVEYASHPPLAMLHAGGRLHVGFAAGVIERQAMRYDTQGSSLSGLNTQSTGYLTALAYDRVGRSLFAIDSNGALFRLNPAASGGASVALGNVGTGVVSAAFSEQFGGAQNAGLYLGLADGSVRFVSAAAARGSPPVVATDYANGTGVQEVSAGADGSLLIGDVTGVRRVTDTSDTRLGFNEWLADEVRQQVVFAKGLISPQGEPAGWVIDGDVASGAPFHPATPDAAAWAVLLLTASDELFNDPDARPLVRTILQRYAGQLQGPAPSRNADGMFRHWIDPLTGGVKPGWDPEFATMSTMKIVAAAARAGNHFSGDAEIVSAARAICCSVRNWDAYVQQGGGTSSRSMYLKGDPAGGPVAASISAPFHEGLIFVEQAAFYGSQPGTRATYASWLDWASMPYASYIGRRIVGTSNTFAPAFISVYPLLLGNDYRSRADWRGQVANVSSAAAAWTDDNSPRWFTVFSAGTTKPEWGGYHADAINDSPGNVATFTALCGLAARADGLGVREATAAYHAYRTGARQTFRSGASMLFRRSSTDPTWSPTDAGMPDVGMGGLGLADVLSQGFVDRVLMTSLPVCSSCTADIGRAGGVPGADGMLDNNDFIAFISAFFGGDGLTADLGHAGGLPGGDGALDNNDFIAFISAYFGGC
ncbi:MAG: GC-type dockerin domain-anchored protein [Phycisphaerales bacterium]